MNDFWNRFEVIYLNYFTHFDIDMISFQMYSRAIVRSFLARPSAYNKLAANSSTAAVFQAEPKAPVQGVMQVREDKIVGRDIVGYGLNGEPQYFDSITFPFPSVRFMKNTPEIVVR